MCSCKLLWQEMPHCDLRLIGHIENATAALVRTPTKLQEVKTVLKILFAKLYIIPVSVIVLKIHPCYTSHTHLFLLKSISFGVYLYWSILQSKKRLSTTFSGLSYSFLDLWNLDVQSFSGKRNFLHKWHKCRQLLPEDADTYTVLVPTDLFIYLNIL